MPCKVLLDCTCTVSVLTSLRNQHPFVLCSNGSQNSTWKEVVRKAWSCFWANCRARGWRSWGLKRWLRLLDRCVKPFVMHRLQVWGATKSVVKPLADCSVTLCPGFVAILSSLVKRLRLSSNDVAPNHGCTSASQCLTGL